MQSKQLKLIGITDGAPKRSRILNILHVPKTGGSSVWHTIADFSEVKNPPLVYDFYYEAIKDQLPFGPGANAICFFGDSGLWSEYCGELYHRHASSQARFAKAFAPTIADSRVVTHTHFPAPIGTQPEGTVNVSTTRESGSRFLSHAAHCLRELRRYQDAVSSGAYARQPLLSEFADFPRNKSLLDFCSLLAELRPVIATFQLRYLLACFCSTNRRQSFEIMAKWSNREVIREFKRSLEFMQEKTTTIRLEEDGQFLQSARTQEALGKFGFEDFQVNRSVLETVVTPLELKGNNRSVCEMFSADQAFRKHLAAENELLRELHGLPSFRSRVRYFLWGSGWQSAKCA